MFATPGRWPIDASWPWWRSGTASSVASENRLDVFSLRAALVAARAAPSAAAAGRSWCRARRRNLPSPTGPEPGTSKNSSTLPPLLLLARQPRDHRLGVTPRSRSVCPGTLRLVRRDEAVDVTCHLRPGRISILGRPASAAHSGREAVTAPRPAPASAGPGHDHLVLALGSRDATFSGCKRGRRTAVGR